jgi:hypothetical protein
VATQSTQDGERAVIVNDSIIAAMMDKKQKKMTYHQHNVFD